MNSLQKVLGVFVLLSMFLAACGPLTAIPINTPPVATEKPSVPNTPTPAVSKLNVEKEALRGVQVKVWHPWFGAQASLFESQVAQFNKENEWGVIVSAEGQQNYGELYLQTTNALKDSSNPQIVIALREHALGWDTKVVDVNIYLHDPDYGMNALDISDFANAVCSQTGCWTTIDAVTQGQKSANSGKSWVRTRSPGTVTLDRPTFGGNDRRRKSGQELELAESRDHHRHRFWVRTHVSTSPVKNLVRKHAPFRRPGASYVKVRSSD